MADVKHTPGHWQLLEVGDKSPRLCPADKHGCSILTVVEEGGITFAAVYSNDDARLISAAPDLLEALIAAEQALEHAGSHLHADRCREVIAKATGAAA